MQQERATGKYPNWSNKVLGLIIVFMAILIINAHPTMAYKAEKLASIDSQAKQLHEQLQAISPYIKTDERGRQKLLRNEAQRAGVSSKAIELGQKIVVTTNRLYNAAMNNKPIENEPIDVSFIQPLFEAIATNMESERFAMAPTISASRYSCMGLQSRPDPCPQRRPTWQFFSSQTSVTKFLTNAGFHKTAGYACNNNPYDYTATVSSNCGWRTFRTQATLRRDFSRWSFETQGPEPNPEILSYPWPVPWWGSYVLWWHRSYC